MEISSGGAIETVREYKACVAGNAVQGYDQKAVDEDDCTVQTPKRNTCV